MRYSFVAAALAAPIFAAPTKRQAAANIDTTVLQFALTLEHLENVFYKQALAKFTQDHFVAAGYKPSYYNNLKYISNDEQDHVDLLTNALTAAGQKPVAECTYDFPYTDVNSFVTLSSVLEGVGTSAYLGGAPLITSKAYLTVAGSILVTEALHTSLQRGANNEIPFPTPYGTPLDPTSVFTLAAAFIKNCPSSNMALPFTPYPSLALNTTAGFNELPADFTAYGVATSPPVGPKFNDAIRQHASIKLTSSAAVPAGAFVTYVSGLRVVSVPATISGNSVMADVPNTVAGQVYTFITKTAANGTLASGSVVSGPAILEIFPAAPSVKYGQGY